jgi:ATP-dependent helicase HrpB
MIKAISQQANLPIQNIIPQIISTLQEENNLILQAPPGAGKTTAVHVALLHESDVKNKKIMMLEPRRLATRSAALYMASLLNEKVGETIGYIIHGDTSVSKKSKVIVVTEGILTRMIQSDPELSDIGLIIFDEFHERNIHGELALALALQSQEFFASHIKLLVMSATLNIKAVSTLLNNASTLTSEGRSFDITIEHLPKPELKKLSTTIATLIKNIIKDKTVETILVFLPGIKEIKSCQNELNEKLPSLVVETLYGAMNQKEQDRAILKSSYQKVVLSTNIAQTSLTINGVNVVIDSGLERISKFNSGSGMDSLETLLISQESATQRAGRAGRTSHGTCYRLYPQFQNLVKQSQPEILRADVTSMMLELAFWGTNDVNELLWLDTPPSFAVNYAQNLLLSLGALDNNFHITTHGEALLKLGVHPRLGDMILKAIPLKLGDMACDMAALLSEKDIFPNRTTADITSRLIEFHNNTYKYQQVLKTSELFKKRVSLKKNSSTYEYDMCGVLLAFAFPDRVAQCRDNKNHTYLLSNAKGATLHFEDTLVKEPYLVVAELGNSQHSNAQIYKAAPISLQQIKSYLSTTISEIVQWSEKLNSVESKTVEKIGALILNEKENKKVNALLITKLLLSKIREKGLSFLELSKDNHHFLQRVNFINSYHDENNSNQLPDLSEAWLIDNLELWLEPHLIGIKSLKSLLKLDFTTILLSQLNYQEQQYLEKAAPKKLKVPSGSFIMIDYSDKSSPTLSVRLQELFGLYETPKVLNNSVVLTIELLSPAHRPMQITKDLQSFWKTTYHDVKKDLKGKYKRHYWPDDPFEAKATSKTKKWM